MFWLFLLNEKDFVKKKKIHISQTEVLLKSFHKSQACCLSF